MKSASLIEIVQQLETIGFIKHKMVPYASPSFLVSKKNVDTNGNEVKTGHRLVVDYRALNANTQVPISPFPDLRAVLDSLHGCNYFSLLDLHSGFHQILVDEPTHDLLAFTTPIGTYVWLVMPFGPSGCPTYCHAEISYLLSDILFKNVSLWGDDIIIGGSTIGSCVQRTVYVLERLQANKWYLNAKKCKFAQPSLKSLGVIIQQGVFTPDLEKFEVICRLPYHLRRP